MRSYRLQIRLSPQLSFDRKLLFLKAAPHPRLRKIQAERRKEEEANMRSELIFRASETVDNKYKLCQVASKATRHLHISVKSTTDTINDVFLRIARDNEPALLAGPLVAAS